MTIRSIPVGLRRYWNSRFTLRRPQRVESPVVIAWSLFLCVLFLYAVDSFVKVPGTDSGSFLYVAKGIIDGKMPYIDMWDHKGPLLYIINVAGVVISNVWGIWLVQIGFLAGTCLSAYKLFTDAQFGTATILFLLTIFLVIFEKFVDDGNMVEQYALLFQFLALSLFVKIECRADPPPPPPTRWLLLGLGSLGAASFCIRPNLIDVWVAIGLYWLIYRNGSARKFIWAGVGGGVVLLVIAAWFAAAGGLYHLWEAVFVYNVTYSDFSFNLKDKFASFSPDLFFPMNWVVLFGWSIGLWQTFTSGLTHFRLLPRRIFPLATILLPISLMLSSLSSLWYRHYYLTMIPASLLVSAFVIETLLHVFRTRFPWIIPTALMVVTVFVFSMHYIKDPLIPNDIRKYSNLVEFVCCQNSVINHIKENMDEDNHILVWGADSKIYFLSGTTAPTRFFYQYPLFRRDFANNDYIKEFIADVVYSRPAMIIDTHRPTSSTLSLTMVDLERSHPRLQPFFEFVKAHYELVKTIDKYDVYHKK